MIFFSLRYSLFCPCSCGVIHLSSPSDSSSARPSSHPPLSHPSVFKSLPWFPSDTFNHCFFSSCLPHSHFSLSSCCLLYFFSFILIQPFLLILTHFSFHLHLICRFPLIFISLSLFIPSLSSFHFSSSLSSNFSFFLLVFLPSFIQFPFP